MLVKRIIPSLSVQDGPVKNDVWLVPLRMDRKKTRSGLDVAHTRVATSTAGGPAIALNFAGTLEHINEGLSEGLSEGTLGTSIFHDGTFTVADARTYFAERGLSVRPASRTLQPREMS